MEWYSAATERGVIDSGGGSWRDKQRDVMDSSERVGGRFTIFIYAPRRGMRRDFVVASLLESSGSLSTGGQMDGYSQFTPHPKLR